MKSLFLLIVIGQCFSTTCHLPVYHLIEDEMTWDEAQRYCRENYTDLATVSDMTDAQSLSELVDGKEAWIGLSSNQGRDNRQWHWSLPGLAGVDFRNIKKHFGSNEPNDGGFPENCVQIQNGKLIDNWCSFSNGFICLNGADHTDGRFTRIDEKKNWSQAQSYCREHHIDLASGLDILKDETFRGRHHGLWFGLFRDTWTWSDGNSSGFRNWDQGLFKDGIERRECATVSNKSGKWGSDGCDERKPFFCYDSQRFSTTCHLHEYYLIEDEMTWDEAQRYCREEHTDLATVSDMTDAQRLSELVDGKEAWIGLSSNQGGDNRQWHWSLPGLPGVNFSDVKEYFHRNEPNDGSGPENCVQILNGKLIDKRCSSSSGFICLNEADHPDRRFTRIGRWMNWTQAQNYCREHHIDLASGLNVFEDDTFLKLLDYGLLWFGLFRDTWTWSDGSNSGFRNWDQGLFKDGIDRKECATVLDESGKWGSDGCDEKKPFFCYDDKVVLVKQRLTWEQALYYCRDNYNDLVSITNRHQQRWVQARAKNASTSHVWLGLRYTCTLDFWFWISDEVVSYKNWAPGQEMDGCDMSGAMAKEGDHQWFKKQDEEKFNFICSKD